MCVQANILIIMALLVPEFLLDNFQVLLSNIYSQFEMASTVFDIYGKREWRLFII